MKQKSKFITFILSFIPGLGHLYLGFSGRALVFFTLLALSVLGTAGMSALAGTDRFFILLLFAIPIIWFVALVDSLSLAEKLHLTQQNREAANPDLNNILSNMSMSNQKIITVALSIIPGAGHMYLGFLKEGTQLMAGFFFTAFLMGWLNLSILVFILPVIWFYSLFDAYHRMDEKEFNGQTWEEIPFFQWFSNHPRWIGWGLIVFGCLILFEKIVSPLLSWQIRHYLQTAIVALIFILGGIKMLAGNKVQAYKGKKGAGEDLEVEKAEFNARQEDGVSTREDKFLELINEALEEDRTPEWETDEPDKVDNKEEDSAVPEAEAVKIEENVIDENEVNEK